VIDNVDCLPRPQRRRRSDDLQLVEMLNGTVRPQELQRPIIQRIRHKHGVLVPGIRLLALNIREAWRSIDLPQRRHPGVVLQVAVAGRQRVARRRHTRGEMQRDPIVRDGIDAVDRLGGIRSLVQRANQTCPLAWCRAANELHRAHARIREGANPV